MRELRHRYRFRYVRAESARNRCRILERLAQHSQRHIRVRRPVCHFIRVFVDLRADLRIIPILSERRHYVRYDVRSLLKTRARCRRQVYYRLEPLQDHLVRHARHRHEVAGICRFCRAELRRPTDLHVLFLQHRHALIRQCNLRAVA